MVRYDSERDIENYLTTQITKAGGLCWKFQSSRAGVPDRIILFNNQIVFAELKAPGGKPRKLQERIHAQMRRQGATIVIVDSYESADALVRSLQSAL